MQIHNSISTPSNTNPASSDDDDNDDNITITTTSTANTVCTMNTSHTTTNTFFYKHDVEKGRQQKQQQQQQQQQHMVDIIDPDAVDFEPLILKNKNELKVGHHYRRKQSLTHHENDSSHSGTHTESETVPLTATTTDGTSSISSSLPTTTTTTTQKNYHQTKKDTFRNIISKLNYIKSKLLHSYLIPFISQHIEPNLRDPSFHSSIFICSIFFFLIFIFGSIASYMTDSQNSLFFPNMSSSSFKVITGGQPPPQNIALPGTVDVYADVDEELDITDTAVFWHVPRSGGTTMKNVMAMCLGRVVATEVGGQEGHAVDETLVIIPKPYGNYVNVDTTTILGLKHAKDLGLAPSRMAEVVFTPYIHEASILFDSHYRGRFFTVLRDPVDRIVSLYYYRQMSEAGIRNTTLAEFGRTYGDNWHVRMLSDEMTGPVTVHHLNIAKEILRRKFLIGLLEEKTETLRRIETYFGWNFPSPVAQNCKNMKFYFQWNGFNEHPTLDYSEEADQKVIEVISKQNRFDVELYRYAVNLFQEQGERLFWVDESIGEEEGPVAAAAGGGWER